MRILVIEDDSMMRLWLHKILSEMGHVVRLAENGMKGVGQFFEFDPEIIICDLIMPGLSGAALLRMLRNTYHFEKPAILISASSQRYPSALAIDSGANVFLHKPFTREQLSDRISRITGQAS